jgi:hypothetical protein
MEQVSEVHPLVRAFFEMPEVRAISWKDRRAAEAVVTRLLVEFEHLPQVEAERKL